MLKGAGRHFLSKNSFARKPDLGKPETSSVGRYKALSYGYESTPGGAGGFVPDNTTLRSFANAVNVPADAGLVSRDPKSQIMLAREIYDNDPIAGAVVETFASIPFGSFSLAGLPNKEVQKPYEISLDRIRAKTLMPVLAASHLVDGAFLGGGLFDEKNNVWNCVTGDTLIPTTKGIMRIDEMLSGKASKQKIDFEVASRFGKEKVGFGIKKKNQNITKIVTDLGLEIKGTGLHKMLVFYEGKHEWIKIGDIKPGMRLCINLNSVCRNESLTINLTDLPKNTCTITPKKPTIMTPQLAFIMGLIVSEGCFNSRDVEIDNTNEKLIKIANKYLSEIFNVKGNVYEKELKSGKISYSLRITNVQIKHWLKELGLGFEVRTETKCQSYFKVIPWSILQADKESQLAFIAAYIEGDGCAWEGISRRGYSNHNLSITSYSEELIKQMQIMLLSHGYLSTKCSIESDYWKKCNKSHLAHSVRIGPKFASKLMKDAKKYFVSKYTKFKSNDVCYVHSVPLEYFKNLIETRKEGRAKYKNDEGNIINTSISKEIKANFNKDLSNLLYENKSYDGYLKFFKEISTSAYNSLLECRELQYVYPVVTKKSKAGKADVYDLTVINNGEPAYVANGLICHNSIVPYDLLFAEVTPVPFFGSTPIVDVRINPDNSKNLKQNDDRMLRYRKYLPEQFFTSGGVIRLPLENTFYIPRNTRADVPLGVSLYRKIMILYLLDKALMRGTIQMAHRRQRPGLHIQAGDENWEASVDEMTYLSGLFQSADLDPLGAVVVTRPGVITQEFGGLGDMWKWTDTVDVISAMKLKGLGMPDGLLGGDMALDSVSATLTIFINMIRQFREHITRLFYYEKLFPYVSITNGHRKSEFKHSEFGQAEKWNNIAIANDLHEEIDIEDYFTPTVTWHSSLRPEGDREYMELLDGLRQAGVPIPIRVMAAAGGLNIHDLINSSSDDLADRQKIAEINAKIAAMDQASGGGMEDDGSGGQQYASEQMLRELSPIKRKKILEREYDYDRYSPANIVNGKRYVMTARERRRIDEKTNRLTASAAAELSKKLNREKPRPVKRRG